MPLALVPHDGNGIITGGIEFSGARTIKMGCNMPPFIIWYNFHWHHMIQTVSSMTLLKSLGQDDWNGVQHDFFDHMMTLTSASTTYDANGTLMADLVLVLPPIHIIPINNYLNMTNALVSLMAPSASCAKNHTIAMYMPKTNMPSNATSKLHLQISSCAHMRQLCLYICLTLTQCNQQYDQKH